MKSPIATDETVQFFRSAANYHSDTRQWRISIHGWVFEPQQSRFRKALFSKIVQWKYGIKVKPEQQTFYERRINLIIADNERGKRINIHIAGKQFTLPPSAANGHFSDEILLDEDTVAAHAINNRLTYFCTSKDGREFNGEVQLVSPHGLSIISDIDDTVKISNVLNRQQLIDHTFLQAFVPVGAMNTHYQQLSQQQNETVSAFHFVSSSPWQLYAPLQEFLDAHQFPWATLSLKSIRFRDMTLFNLFKPGTATKPAQINAIMDRFPQRQFILVGDSGEQDPEVYAAVAATHPTQVRGIYIRNITDEHLSNSRFQALVGEGVDWRLFTHPNEIQF